MACMVILEGEVERITDPHHLLVERIEVVLSWVIFPTMPSAGSSAKHEDCLHPLSKLRQRLI